MFNKSNRSELQLKYQLVLNSLKNVQRSQTCKWTLDNSIYCIYNKFVGYIKKSGTLAMLLLREFPLKLSYMNQLILIHFICFIITSKYVSWECSNKTITFTCSNEYNKKNIQTSWTKNVNIFTWIYQEFLIFNPITFSFTLPQRDDKMLIFPTKRTW